MINIKNITKKFQSFTALDNISCTIPTGCIFGLVGTNGAGKSTLLRIITGIYRPETGEITFDGQPVYNNPEVKSRIAFLADELYFLPGATIKKMAKHYSMLYPHFDTQKCFDLAKALDLDIRANVNSFSKGMRRQASITLALATNPKYIFFDETFDGLDPIIRNVVRSLICKEVVDRKATAVISSHSLRELEDICDQLALLHKGGLVLQSDVGNLKTSLFKVQIALGGDFSKETFAKTLNILNFRKSGSVANIIIRGDREKVVDTLEQMQPLLMDILPLTLEEVFTYEMENLGYDFQKLLKEENPQEAS